MERHERFRVLMERQKELYGCVVGRGEEMSGWGENPDSHYLMFFVQLLMCWSWYSFLGKKSNKNESFSIRRDLCESVFECVNIIEH